MTKTKTYLLLFFIIALGLYLRVYNIENVPPGIYPDEAANGIDAMRAAETGQFQWFYSDNNGREGLFMNIIAMCFKFFGMSIFTLKLPSIIFGTLAILGTYLLTRELFSSRRIGLISSFLMAVSFWAINFSRIGFRAIMVPAILVFSFYFLFKGLRTRKWQAFAAGGLIFGLGLHTYIAFRIAPLILAAMLFILLLTRENFLKKYWALILIFVFFATLSAGPMMYDFFISHPEHWESRTGNISILNPEVNQGHLVKTFMKTFGLALAKYNFWGDQNWRHNFPPYALLDPLTGIAFLFGFVYSLIKMFHLLVIRFVRKIRDTKLEVHAFLLLWFFAMLIPEVMGYEGNPHALRAIGTLPAVFLFAAMTFNYFLGKVEDKAYTHKKIIASLIILMLFSIGVFNSVKYHSVWAKKAEVAQAFEKTTGNIGNYIKTLPKDKEVFVVVGNMQRIPPRFFSWGNSNFHDLHPMEIGNIEPKNIFKFEVIFTDYQKDKITENLISRFPNLKLEEKKDNFGESFYILK